MKKILGIASLAMVGILISGCAVKSGNEKLAEATTESVKSQIVKGVTTKDEIKQMYGDPTKVDFMSNGQEKWEYEHKKSREKVINYVPIVSWFVKGTNDEKKSLIVLFNDEKVVNYTSAFANGETMGGLIN